MFFSNVHYTILRDYLLDYLKKVFPLDTTEAFLCGNIFDLKMHFKGEKARNIIKQ